MSLVSCTRICALCQLYYGIVNLFKKNLFRFITPFYNYFSDFKSKEMRVRQRSVALYFIDKLALRAGNEKDEDQADTVGCCSLRVEHIKLHEEHDGD